MWGKMKSPVHNWISSWIYHREKIIYIFFMPLVYSKSMSCHTSKQQSLRGRNENFPLQTHIHRWPQLQQHEHCSSYQGANSSFPCTLVPPFLGDRKPETSQELSASDKTCTSRNPSGLCGHWVHHWAHVGVRLFPASAYQCENLCCLVAKGTLGTFTHAFYGCSSSVFSLEMFPVMYVSTQMMSKIWPKL